LEHADHEREHDCGGDELRGSRERLLNTSAEIAAVGPDTICQEEPNTAATIGGSSAEKKPYSGGRPAMAANATPWGTMTLVVVRAAKASRRRLSRVSRGRQSMRITAT
jgi:hypothetical protein